MLLRTIKINDLCVLLNTVNFDRSQKHINYLMILDLCKILYE